MDPEGRIGIMRPHGPGRPAELARATIQMCLKLKEAAHLTKQAAIVPFAIHRPSNLVNPRQIQMTFNGLSEGEAWLHRVQERCVPCPKAGREKVAHPV
jgi:hypothetical protein